MGCMTAHMSPIWKRFETDLEAHLQQIDSAVHQSFDEAYGIASSTDADEPSATNSNRSEMLTLAGTLRHRETLALYGIEKACDSFHSAMSSLRTDAFSSIRTAFIGRLLEDTYHAANMEYGELNSVRFSIVKFCLTSVSRCWQ
jgi:hypothetical protein